MGFSKALYATLLCFFLIFVLARSGTSTDKKNVPCPQQASTPNLDTQIGKASSSSANSACPSDVLKLGVCAEMLGQSFIPTIGAPAKMPCCKFLGGLVNLEAAVCLCTAIKANVLGINFDIPVSFSNVFNNCQKKLPTGFKCNN